MQEALGLPLSTEKANAFKKFLSTWGIRQAMHWIYLTVYFNHFATLTSCF